MRRIYFAIGLIGLLLALPGVSRADFKDKATGLNFPSALGDMKQDSVTDFEKEHPGLGLGTGVGYSDARNPKIYADVFVYDLNNKQIPDGSSNPVVAKQISDAERDLFIQEQRGVYSKVKKIKTASRLLGDGSALRSHSSRNSASRKTTSRSIASSSSLATAKTS